MSEYQSYYDNYCRANVWATNEPEECGCRGSGYWSSEVDTWHQCPYHFEKGQAHPEACEEELEAEERKVHTLKYIPKNMPNRHIEATFTPCGTHVKIFYNVEFFETREDARKLYRRMLDQGWEVF